MNDLELTCAESERRQRLRAANTGPRRWNGIDYVETENSTTLIVRLLCPCMAVLADDEERKQLFKILDTAENPLDIDSVSGPEDGGWQFTVTLKNALGDGTYTITFLAPSALRLAPLDQRSLSANFRFLCKKQHVDIDPKPAPQCQPEPAAEPELNYTARDFQSFRKLIADRLALTIPAWRETHVPDIGVAITEILAYVGDHLAQFQDAVATEAYLGTARHRISARRHARLIDREVDEGSNARTYLHLNVVRDVEITPEEMFFITRPTGNFEFTDTNLFHTQLDEIPAARYQAFEIVVAERRRPRVTPPLDPLKLLVKLSVKARRSASSDDCGGDDPQKIKLFEAHNRIEFYTWDQMDCCLPKGATKATLRDWYVNPDGTPCENLPNLEIDQGEGAREPLRALKLEECDLILLEEVIDPSTGLELDANKQHRQVVRLTCVRRCIDRLHNTPVLEVEWSPEDRLAFSLCISSSSRNPPCVPLLNVSVARGNIVPVDHGLTVTDEKIGIVQPDQRVPECEQDLVTRPRREPIKRFRPQLAVPGLMHSVAPQFGEAASAWLEPQPRSTRPAVQLLGIPHDPERNEPIFDPAQLRSGAACASCIAYLNDAASQSLQNSISPWLGQFLVTLQGRIQTASGEQIRAWGRYLCGELLKQLAWEPQIDLLRSSDTEQHFVAEIDDYGNAILRFGEGLGKRPTPGLHFYATYRYGGGEAGNVGADSIQHVVFRSGMHEAIRAVRNPLPAEGGRAPQSLESIKLIKPNEQAARPERAIIAEDYVKLVNNEFQPRVNGARCSISHYASFTFVEVTIDPSASEKLHPLLEEIKDYLTPLRRAGHRLVVSGPRYVGIQLTLLVRLKSGHARAQVRLDLLNRFGQGTLSGGKLAFFHPDKYTFGDTVYASRIVEEGMKAQGVQSVDVLELKLARPHASGSARRCKAQADSTPTACKTTKAKDVPDLKFGDREIPRLLNDPTRPDSGRLDIQFCENDDATL